MVVDLGIKEFREFGLRFKDLGTAADLRCQVIPIINRGIYPMTMTPM